MDATDITKNIVTSQAVNKAMDARALWAEPWSH
jgi:hypothetical protein